jgi:hypothetical protein
VLKDGASSTYGADAIGGVVNLILKKQFVGVSRQRRIRPKPIVATPPPRAST